MAEEDLGGFLAGLQGRLTAATQAGGVSPQQAVRDEEFTYFTTPAPNAIEWAVRPDLGDVDSIYHHVRQYQIIRDFFQLRCPLSSCNDQSPDAVDCWNKGREYLQSENLLIYNASTHEDICPSCRTTRSEFLKDGLLQTYNQMHVVAGMRTTPISTHVYTNNGLKRFAELLPADPVVDTFYPLNGMRVFGINGWEEVSDVYYSGILPSKIIKLKNGIEHVVSHVHPLYGFNNGVWGWHRANTLNVGSYIQTNIAPRWTGTSTEVSPDEAAILGYLVSEGSISSEKSWKFTNGDADTISHYSNLVAAAFNCHVGIYGNNKNKCLSAEVCNSAMRSRLRALGLKASVANTKVVPEMLWSSTEDVACAYLRAYFEGDGTASVERELGAKNKTKKPVVACYTVSKQLALDTQQMLMNLGIESSIVASRSRRFGTGGLPFEHDSYSIRIYGKNIVQFANKIGFNSSRKRSSLAECVDRVSEAGTREDRIPGLRDVLNRIHDKISFTAELSAFTVGVRSGRYESISKSLIVELLHYLDGKLDDADTQLLRQLSQDGTRFIKISAIKDGPDLPMADLHVPGTHSYVANSVMNHNSGKTSVAGVIGTYVEHKLITLGHSQPRGLSKFFNQLPKQPFEITFIASTDVQSADTIWARYTSLRQNSPWLGKYIRWLKQKETDQTTPNGVKPWAYEEREKYIVNGALNLKINSMNSNSAGMAGRTRIAAFIDELARFENTDSAGSADECYRVLENSLRTLRSSVMKYPVVSAEANWLGAMFSISSPISEDDKSMRLLKQAPTVKGMYYGHYATWDFNPDQSRDMFNDDFEKDPIGAMRDFGARPPTTASPLISDPNKFRELAIQRDLRPSAEFKKYIHQDKTGREYVSLKADTAQLLRNGERYIAFDAGASFDQFAGACAHGEWVQTPEGKQLVTVFDWVVRVLPEGKPRKDVWFDFVIQMLDFLGKYQHIGRVEFDRWQSTYLIQQIRNRGIMCEMKGTTADHFNKLINDVNYSKVRMLPPMPDDPKVDPPFMSAAGLAFYELERLERTPDLKKVHNPKKGFKRGWESDDVATVVAHVNYMVQSSVIDIDNSNAAGARLRREQAGGHGAQGGQLFRPHVSRRLW